MRIRPIGPGSPLLSDKVQPIKSLEADNFDYDDDDDYNDEGDDSNDSKGSVRSAPSSGFRHKGVCECACHNVDQSVE